MLDPPLEITRIPHVPVIPGFDPLLSNKFIGPLEDTSMVLGSEVPNRIRWWAACGAIVVASSIPFIPAVRAFPQHYNETIPPDTCKVVAISEVAKNTVRVQLEQPASKEDVLIGNFAGVMEAQPVPGSPTTYWLETAYLHNDVIGAYIGPTMCEGEFDFGSAYPGDERLFDKKART